MKPRGKFVVFEGPDGAGKTTLVKLVGDALVERGQSCWLTAEPTRERAGKLIRDDLLAVRENRATGSSVMHWQEQALLFAADRVRHCEEIEALLGEHQWVLCDRYELSNHVYQLSAGPVRTRLEQDVLSAWIRTINQAALVPDLMFVLQVPEEQLLARLQGRGVEPSRFELPDFHARVVEAYAWHRCFHAPARTVLDLLGDVAAHEVAAEALELLDFSF